MNLDQNKSTARTGPKECTPPPHVQRGVWPKAPERAQKSRQQSPVSAPQGKGFENERLTLTCGAPFVFAKTWVKKSDKIAPVELTPAQLAEMDMWKGYERFRALAKPYKLTASVSPPKLANIKVVLSSEATCFYRAACAVATAADLETIRKRLQTADLPNGANIKDMSDFLAGTTISLYDYNPVSQEVDVYYQGSKKHGLGVLCVPPYMDWPAHALPVLGCNKKRFDLAERGLQWNGHKITGIVQAGDGVVVDHLKLVCNGCEPPPPSEAPEAVGEETPGEIECLYDFACWCRELLDMREEEESEAWHRVVEKMGEGPKGSSYSGRPPQYDGVDHATHLRMLKRYGSRYPSTCVKAREVEFTVKLCEPSFLYFTWFDSEPEIRPLFSEIRDSQPESISSEIAFVNGVAAPPFSDVAFSAQWHQAVSKADESNLQFGFGDNECMSRWEIFFRQAIGSSVQDAYELHPASFKSGSVITPETLLYWRVAREGITYPLTVEGSYDADLISYIATDLGNYRMNVVKQVTYHGCLYKIFALEPSSVGFLGHLATFLPRFAAPRATVQRVQFKTRPIVEPRVSNMVGPNQDAQVRLLYQLTAGVAKPEHKALLNDARNAEFEEKNRTGVEPTDVLRAIQYHDAALQYQCRTERVWAVNRPNHHTCVCCGAPQPKGRFRWKHRICDKCQVLLKTGAVTWSGHQVIAEQSTGQVPTVAPGICKKASRQYPPSEKKWAGVDLNGGSVKVSRALLHTRGKARGALWEAVTPGDLSTFDAPFVPAHVLALAGIACSGASPMLSAKTQYNNLKALMGRVFRRSKLNGPRPGVYQWLRQFVPHMLPNFRAPSMTVKEWLGTMPSRRRRVLERAWEEYQRCGWKAKYKGFSAFVKEEMLPDFSKDAHGLRRMTEMLDRLIQGPNDVTHVIAGPVLKPLVKKLKDIWTYDSPIFYGSATPEKLHKWLQLMVAKGGTYFWCDYSMYDNTHSDDSWDFMEDLYKPSVGDRPDFWRVMRAWRTPKGKIGAFKYQARTMNASGRDDTALANGVLNGFAAYLSAAAAYLQVPLLSLTPEDYYRVAPLIKISVCGDDSLGSLPEMSAARMQQFCADMSANIAMFGFEAKLQASNRLYDAVYLGHRPYPTKKGWFWGKTIGRATYKMGWVIDKGQDLMAHMTGLADMHVLCNSHVPILSDLAEKIVELRRGAKRTPVQPDPNRPWEWPFQSNVPYDEVTLQAVCDMYTARATATTSEASYIDTSLTRDELEQLIAQIRGVTTLPCVIDSPVWRKIVWMDDL